MPVLTRVLGAATTAYSVAIIAKPRLLAKPCGLTTETGAVSPGVRPLVGGIGARDVVLGVAMMTAAPGRPLRLAVAGRVAADLSDALIFGLSLPDRAARRKVAAFATGWAALCAASAFTR
jgi:hypothetical protein